MTTAGQLMLSLNTQLRLWVESTKRKKEKKMNPPPKKRVILLLWASW
jgi:hypothetical protein